MYVDVRDNRARKLIAEGSFNAQTTAMWLRLVAALEPAVVLDVGANYGEMLLPLRLPLGARGFAFEPNPHVGACLRRSLRAHPQRRQLTLVPAAVSDTEGREVFNVDRKWSGTSSLDFAYPDEDFKGAGAQSFDTITVETTTLDAFAARTLGDAAPVALKVDVEGHEPQVFAGARALLSSRPFVAFFEADPKQLQWSGNEPSALLAALVAHGALYRLHEWRELVPIDASYSFGHEDLVLTNVDDLPARING